VVEGWLPFRSVFDVVGAVLITAGGTPGDPDDPI
jgi:hypothetical protein